MQFLKAVMIIYHKIKTFKYNFELLIQQKDFDVQICNLYCFYITDTINKTIYELDYENCDVTDEDKSRFAQTSLFRAQIKELIHQRQDLREELQQTLKQLVLNKVPLSNIDGKFKN